MPVAKKTTKTTEPAPDTIIGQDDNKDVLEVAIKRNVPALLVGETGTGKTSIVRELAHKHNRPYSRFSITGETTVDDFVGKFVLKDGETKWQDGMLLTAIKKGHYLVVDEINAALPEILFVLHSLLDDDKYVVVPQKDNSIVKPSDDFRFFATMNPTDEYAGTKELNKAFMSRFAVVLNIEYPARDIETRILMERGNMPAEDAMKMVDVAIRVRKLKEQDKIFYTLSTRDLLYWANLSTDLGLHRAFRVSICNKSQEDYAVVEQEYQKVHSDYERAKSNQPNLTNLEYYTDTLKKLEKMQATNIKKAEKLAQESVKKERAEVDEVYLAISQRLEKETGMNRKLFVEALKQGAFNHVTQSATKEKGIDFSNKIPF